MNKFLRDLFGFVAICCLVIGAAIGIAIYSFVTWLK